MSCLFTHFTERFPHRELSLYEVKNPSKPFVMGKLLKLKEIYQLLDVAGLEISCGAL